MLCQSPKEGNPGPESPSCLSLHHAYEFSLLLVIQVTTVANIHVPISRREERSKTKPWYWVFLFYKDASNRLNIYIPSPKKFISQNDVLGDSAFRESPHGWDKCLVKRPQNSFAPLTCWSYAKRQYHWWSRKQAHTRHWICLCLNLQLTSLPNNET